MQVYQHLRVKLAQPQERCEFPGDRDPVTAFILCKLRNELEVRRKERNCSLVSGHAKEICFSLVHADSAFGYDGSCMYRQTALNLLNTLVARHLVAFKIPFAVIKPPASS